MKDIRSFFVSGACVLLLLANYFCWSILVEINDKNLYIKFLNVGQGDSYLVKTPDKITLLVDAGRDSRALAAVKENLELWHQLNLIMLSHPDADHMGSMAEIIKNYGTKQIIINPITKDSNLAKELLEVVKQNGLKVTTAVSGDSFKLGCCVELEIAWPKSASDSSALKVETNEQSIGFFLKYGNFLMFSAGDLGSANEDLIASQLKVAPIDLLKVSHHGSKNSSSVGFLQKLMPATSVIQVGKNSYGHPSTEVLQALAANQRSVLRNDENGTITYITDGINYRVTLEK